MKKVRAIITILVLAFLGVFLLTMNVSTSQDPVNLADITVEDLEKKGLYYAEDLIFMDVYAAMEDEDVLYAAVMFEDANGDYVVVNMPVNKSTDIWDGVNDYLDDYTMQMGDYEISGYLVCEKNVDVDDKLFDLFEEWVDDLEREAGISVETNNDLRFNYLCDEDGDPAAEMSKSNTVFTIFGVACLVLAVVILYFALLRKPKAKVITPAAGYTVPAYPTQPMNDAVNAQLQSYRSMVQNGLMTEEEFAAKQRELLGQ